MTDLFRFLQAVVLVYLVLVALRIIITWFRGADHHAPTEILARVTDPYLRWFQRLRFLRVGVLDFSPAAAILVLIVAGNVLQRLAAAQRVTAGIVLAQVLLGHLVGGVGTGGGVHDHGRRAARSSPPCAGSRAADC